MAKENSKMDMAQDKKMVKSAIKQHDDQLHGGKKTDLASLKKGGGVKKMLGGGLASALSKGVANAVKQNPNMGGTASLGGMGRIGAAAKGSGFAQAATKAIKANRPMKKGGSVSSASSRADGCATKGKTKGRML